MARQPRVDYPGAWHHVLNQGRRLEPNAGPLFSDDSRCEVFLSALGKVTQRCGVEVHAYSLVQNHYHLLVRSLNGRLSRVMQTLAGRYTQSLNEEMGWDGPVFQGRFKNQVIEDPGYLRYLVAYMHLSADRWTSHRLHVGLEPPSSWLQRSLIDQEFPEPDSLQRCLGDLQSGRKPWPENLNPDTGWLKPARRRSLPAGRLEMDPDHVVARVLALTNATRAQIETSKRGRGANPERRLAIWLLNRHTTLLHAEIATVVRTTRQHVANMVHKIRTRGPKPPVSDWLERWDSP